MNTRSHLVTVEDLVAAVRRQQVGVQALAWMPRPGPSVDHGLVVDSAHPGAGASTVAVALADVLGARGDVTLIDLASDGVIGASEAIEVRADLGQRGWVGGRRGTARIVQPVESPSGTDEPVGNVIVDAAEGGWGREIDVLVCRATVPSIRKAELILARVHPLVVAVVGASKWPSPVRSSLGPAMYAAWAVGGAVFFPHESALEVNGLTAEPLPATTLRAARRLLDFLEHRQPSDSDIAVDENGDLS